MSTTFFSRLARIYGSKSSIDLTRRQTLQSAAAASALALISCTPARHFASGSRKRVIIIGAGFSGLAAGDHLKRLGYDVTIVEARNRLATRDGITELHARDEAVLRRIPRIAKRRRNV